MNHLAHVLLAGSDPDHRLGAFLGDHVKGTAALDALPTGVAHGVRLHRRIDAWSDAHPAVTALRARSGTGWRRYSGIVFDVLFDTMLVRHWERFGRGTLTDFASDIDTLLAERRPELPQRLVRFSFWARETRLWERYDDRAMLAGIFARLAARHGRPSPLADGLDLLDTMDADIEMTFLRIFPDLVGRARAFRQDAPDRFDPAGADVVTRPG